jgi:hypothetical protein
MMVVVLWMGSVAPGSSPATSIVIVCVPGVSGCKSATPPVGHEKYGRSEGGPELLLGDGGDRRCGRSKGDDGDHQNTRKRCDVTSSFGSTSRPCQG